MTPEALESLNRMLAEAQEKSPDFKKRLAYWKGRKRSPDASWIFKNLVKVLGRDRVAEEVRKANQHAGST